SSLIDERVLKSSKWDSKVDFTLKELILHDIDKRQTEYIENIFTKLQNKILFAFIGATISIIFTIISFNKWYIDQTSEKIDDIKVILNLNKTGKKIIDNIRILLDKHENKIDKNENKTDKKKKK
ncbi:hypothetical protein C1646_767708, partial [Rhizophagus diaphanus]